jgi:hypothetical protein
VTRVTFCQKNKYFTPEIIKEGGAAMIMIVNILLIFIAGFVVDLLSTKFTSYVVSRKIGRAAFLSGIITIVNFAFLTVLLKDSMGEGFFNILAFAGGNSLGTFMAMKKV